MEQTIFFSWQSDLPETRSVISWALERAAKNLRREGSVEVAIRVDQDTAGVAGWPEIASTILNKIERCGVFVADITPINEQGSNSRVTPNPNVMLELGYALATGMRRLRIICVLNAAYLPNKDLKELPFDVRGSRPLVFELQDPADRDVTKGEEDAVRTAVRTDLALRIERAVQDAFAAVAGERAKRMLGVTPHLATDGVGTFQVILQVETAAPFQADYLIKEPSGNVLSGIMMSPARVDPKGESIVRFRADTLRPLTAGNDIYVLSGRIAHLPTNERPAPEFHQYEVRYRLVRNTLIEISRQQPPIH
jgi:hypothetical protein